jgi:hypothetical protein
LEKTSKGKPANERDFIDLRAHKEIWKLQQKITALIEPVCCLGNCANACSSSQLLYNLFDALEIVPRPCRRCQRPLLPLQPAHVLYRSVQPANLLLDLRAAAKVSRPSSLLKISLSLSLS